MLLHGACILVGRHFLKRKRKPSCLYSILVSDKAKEKNKTKQVERKYWWWSSLKFQIRCSGKLLGIYPEKTIIQKNTCTLMFTEVIFTIARTWKQPKCPSTDEWIKKTWYIYSGILLSHKKDWNWVICSDMDGPRVCHTEWSKSEREKYHILKCIYMESRKMVLMNLLAGQEYKHRHREWTCGHSRGRRGWAKLRE